MPQSLPAQGVSVKAFGVIAPPQRHLQRGGDHCGVSTGGVPADGGS